MTEAAPRRIAVSPLARRLAREKGLALSALSGTGPGGRVIARDVAQAMAAPAGPVQHAPARATAAALAQGAAEPPANTLERRGIAPGSYVLTPLDLPRKAMARRMVESVREAPQFQLQIDLEMDRLLSVRQEINAKFAPPGVKISVTDFFVKACALALQRAPETNVSFTEEGAAHHRHSDIAIAVDTAHGLVAPIIREAEAKNLTAISRELSALVERARERRLRPQDYEGGTFSISNLGMMGVRSFTSILNPPQACILSIGAAERRPLVRGEAIEIATLCTVTLTCDHRVVDGAAGARFLKELRAFIDEPAAMLL